MTPADVVEDMRQLDALLGGAEELLQIAGATGLETAIETALEVLRFARGKVGDVQAIASEAKSAADSDELRAVQ